MIASQANLNYSLSSSIVNPVTNLGHYVHQAVEMNKNDNKM